MTTQNNIFEPPLKFSQKTNVWNVNVSNDSCRLSKANTPYSLRVKIELDSCN